MAKKKRKLNKPFVIILCVVGGLLLSVPVALKVVPKMFPKVKWLVRGTPTKRAANAKALYEQGKYAAAAEEYKQAMLLKGSPDAELYTVLGDCYLHLVLAQDDALRLTKAYWDQALSIDPSYLPALKRELDLFRDDAELNRTGKSAQQWEGVGDMAEKVLAVDPNDREAQILKHRAVVEASAAGKEIPPQRIDEATEALAKLANAGPFDADALYFSLQSRIFRGVQRRRAADRDGANEAFTIALKQIDDALAAHPDDNILHFRASQALLTLGLAERDAGQRPKYEDRIMAELDKAAAMVKPEDPRFVEIRLHVAKQQELFGNFAKAVKDYREILAQHPTDISVRLELAQALSRDAATRNEAIELIENAPQPDPKENPGVKGLVQERTQLVAMFEVISTRLDVLPTLKDAPEREASLKKVEETYAKAVSRPGVSDSPLALTALGRIQMVKGQDIEAKQTLDKAYRMMPSTAISTIADLEQRYKLMYLLANACVRTEQTGEAKRYLTELIAVNDKFIPARLMLAQILLREGNKAEAITQLDQLAKLAPDSQLVNKLLALALDPEKDKARIAELYAKLPENTPNDMAEKAQIAAAIGMQADGTRLFEAVLKSVPDDAGVITQLARLYVQSGEKPRAMSLVDSALSRQPDNAQLKLLQAEISGANVAEVRRDVVEATKDPFIRELGLYDLAMQDGKEDEAVKHLQAASGLKPNDGRVMDLLFQQAVRHQDWTKANELVEKLAAMNQDMANGALFRVRLALARGETDKAFDLAQKLTNDVGGIAQSWVVLGQVQRAQHRPLDAIKNFEIALQKQSNNLDAIRGIIAASYETGQPETAARYIQLGRQMFPKLAMLKEAELQHELKYGQPEKVIGPRQEQLKAAIASNDPNEMQAWMALAQAQVAVAQTKETPEAARPLLTAAGETLKQANAKFPDEISFVQMIADTALRMKDIPAGEKAIQDLRARPAWQSKPEPTLLLADYYKRADKPAQQEAVLRDYLKADPRNVTVQTQLAYALSSQKKFDEAMKVLESNIDDPLVRRQRIELQILDKRFGEAEKELASALAANPGNLVLLDRQAYLYMMTGRPTEALGVLNTVLKQSPGDAEALFFRGSIYVSFGKNLDQAIKDLQMVRDAGTNGLSARMKLAEAYRLSGDTESSLRELEDAVAAFPNEKEPRLRLVEGYARATPPRWNLAERTLRQGRSLPQFANDVDLMHAEALMWLERKEPAKAAELVQQALAKQKDNLNLVRTYCRILLESRKYNDLLRATQAMVAGGKGPWWMYEFRGKAQRALDYRKEAMDEFSNGIEVAANSRDDDAVASLVNTIATEIGIAPAKARVYDLAEKGENRWRFLMAQLVAKENDTEGAIGWLDRIIGDAATKPDDLAKARWQAANLNLKLQPPKVARAVELYRKILETNADDLSALNNLACAMILPDSGFKPQEALPYSQKAFNIVQQDPNYAAFQPYIYDTQGYVLVLCGNVQEGINLLLTAIDKQPIPEACYHLGEAYLALAQPQPQQAEEALKQAMTLLESASTEEKPLDTELKSKIEKSLQRARQPQEQAAAVQP
jgi:tetratricopeptide (TPR) repeat protein